MRNFVNVKVQDGYIVFPVGNHVRDITFHMNDMGKEILDMVVSGESDNDIVEKFQKKFPEVEEVKADVTEYLEYLKRTVIPSVNYEGDNNSESFGGNSDDEDIKIDAVIEKIQKSYIVERKPYKVFMEVTTNCNLKCPHCYVQEDITRTAPFNEKEKIFKLLDEMEQEGIVELNITGGECSLHPDFLEIISYAASKNMLVTVLTNGQMISSLNLVDKMMDIPLRDVRISIYGTEEYHDAFVGVKGAFKRSVAALKELRRKKGIGTAAYVVTKENYQYLEIVKNMLAEDNVAISVSPVIMPTIYGDQKPTELRLPADKLMTLVEKGYLPPHGSKCTAGISRYRITPHGDVNPCEMMRDVVLGNVFEEGFDHVIHGEKRKNWIETFVKVLEEHECNHCTKRDFCNTCPGLFFVENGDYITPSSFVCTLAGVKQDYTNNREVLDA